MVHAELCRRTGFRVAWEGVAKQDYLAALTHELERPGSALDAFLAPYVRRPAASVAQDARRLGTLPGLGPAPEPGTTAPPSPPPWTQPPIPLGGRLRAFEARRGPKQATPETAAPEPEPESGAAPDETPRSRPGPKP